MDLDTSAGPAASPATLAARTLPGPALTCCCPTSAVRSARLLSVQDWQIVWAHYVYETWTGGQPAPPVDGLHLCLNWSDRIVPCPNPSTSYRTVWPEVIAPGSVAAVWAWEVLDRHDAPLRLLRRVSTALAPGGLFVATFATWDAEGPDIASGAADRKRIYTPRAWRELANVTLRGLGLSLLGKPDWTYRGHACEDHTLATVVAVKGAIG